VKAREGSRIRLVAETPAEFSNSVFPAGTEGYVVEAYDNPELYSTVVETPAPELVGDIRFHNVLLAPSQFEVIDEGSAGGNEDVS
jgi:hypothetical protein